MLSKAQGQRTVLNKAVLVIPLALTY